MTVSSKPLGIHSSDRAAGLATRAQDGKASRLNRASLSVLYFMTGNNVRQLTLNPDRAWHSAPGRN